MNPVSSTFVVDDPLRLTGISQLDDFLVHRKEADQFIGFVKIVRRIFLGHRSQRPQSGKIQLDKRSDLH